MNKSQLDRIIKYQAYVSSEDLNRIRNCSLSEEEFIKIYNQSANDDYDHEIYFRTEQARANK